VVTPEQRARALTLRAEGMPGPWIAEDLDVSAAVIRRIAPGRPEDHRTWLQVWSAIRRNASMRALHDQFSPAEKYRRA
jgi:hypothetical protein